eukprot:1144232-Pelagomonas_calceolata.AAC.7
MLLTSKSWSRAPLATLQIPTSPFCSCFVVEGTYGSFRPMSLYYNCSWVQTTRLNELTGSGISNETGCTQPAEKQAHFTWLLEMSDALKVAAPKQLVMLGTEGFFGLDDAENKPLNPGVRQSCSPFFESVLVGPCLCDAQFVGAGSACEGEGAVSRNCLPYLPLYPPFSGFMISRCFLPPTADWVKEGMLPAVDVLTMHLYWRQTEGVPDEDWRLMGWHSYMAFFKVYLEAHARIAVMLKKPLLLQEFNILLGFHQCYQLFQSNLTAGHSCCPSRRFSELERDALFAMAFDEVRVCYQVGAANAQA